MNDPKISVIITTYQRFKNLERIYSAWLEQPVEEVWILNGNKNVKLDYGDHPKGVIFNMPRDFGTKMDYAFALLTEGDYIILADDDVLPKKEFAEDLYRGWKQVGGGIVGVIGRKFIGERYGQSIFYRASKITAPARVDFCGVVYFSPRKYFGFDVRGMSRNCDDLWWHMKVFPDVPKHVVPSKNYIDLPEARGKTAMFKTPGLVSQRRRFFHQYYKKKIKK